jgi:hypothetical protein
MIVGLVFLSYIAVVAVVVVGQAAGALVAGGG